MPAALPAPEPRSVRVLVVDDHRVFAGALATRIDTERGYDVVGVVHSADQALLAVRNTAPDVVLLDFRLGEETCLGVLEEVEASRSVQVALIVSGVDDIQHVVDTLDRGASGWVRKDAPFADLLAAVADALDDRIWLPAAMVTPVVRELLIRRTGSRERPRTFVDDLTPRQREVLLMLLGGADRRAIAEQLVLSPHTVRTHIQELLRRSGSSSTLELLAKARAAGAR